MDIINTNRIDSHAKNITEESYLMTSIALKRIEQSVF
jgi:hypothetical protein